MAQRLADVARKVGVSEATVSRVLNGKPGVSESLRERVLTALDVLGYERPTKLRGERARLVGLVMPELSNPIFPALAEVLASALAQSGYTPVLCTQTAGGVSEADYIDLLIAQRVSGVVFAGGDYNREQQSHEHYARLADLGLPTVLMNAAVAGLPFPAVACDDDYATELSIRHLHDLGHERIGLVLGPDDHVPSQRKLVAARRVLGEAGSALDDARVARSAYSLEAGQAAAARLLTAGVTAIVCASDPLALGAIRAAHRAQLSVPDDVSIIGFDDSALMSCTEPPLTTARQPIDAMGRMVIELLLAQIEGTAHARDEYLFEPELVVRGSTGRARR
ncbi:LacI family DNA-binding transcriptional regulator [Galbitalea sp. SE-J8]|uniref:LacI family DNA-binding transcriptional regulator n=1 Tax=Galbitalea sp. SE-J8 TaxID=3054952 RepID=UPI00259D1300|nr:LacI family DNA-binding transcriptional regulator [Galbitalea sp. SE-J8]MDM4763813.1 LacI family DNA-binding transcriptional regulator [Galbitalea sp. SE-J8]